MKILQIIPTLDPCYGGPVPGLRDSTRELTRLGHETEVLTMDEPGAPWKGSLDVPVIPLGPCSKIYRYTPRLAPWLRAHAAEYDSVIVNGVWEYPDAAAWRVLKHSNTPYFLYTHGMLDPWFERAYPFKHIKKEIYWKLWQHRVLRDARAVLFTSEEERRLAAGSFAPFECNQQVVSYGAAAPPDDGVRQQSLFYQKFPELKGRRIVLFLGRMHLKKGCDVLLRAFAAVAPLDPDLQLVMAGPDSSWSPYLRKLANRLGIAHRVTWTGGLFNDLKWGALRSADLFALASHSENFGVSLAEALACGLPVAISDRVNIWREIQQAGAGFVSTDDVLGISGSLRQWLHTPESHQTAMRENALRCFRERFEIRHATQRLLQTLQTGGLSLRCEQWSNTLDKARSLLHNI